MTIGKMHPSLYANHKMALKIDLDIANEGDIAIGDAVVVRIHNIEYSDHFLGADQPHTSNISTGTIVRVLFGDEFDENIYTDEI